MYKKITMMAVAIILAGAGCVAVQNNVNKPKEEEKKVENTTVTTTENTVIDTTNWKTYENMEYGFSFRYPKDKEVQVSSIGWAPDYFVYVRVSEGKPTEGIYNYGFKIEIPVEKKSSLYDFANNIWFINKNDQNPNLKNKIVSDLNEIKINQQTAYQFITNGSFKNESGGSLLDDKYLFTFIDSDKYNLTISFKTSDVLSQQILNTFKVNK